MAFCAAIATAVTVGACGSGMPGNAVVQIGNATITKAALIHWLGVANDASQVQSNTKAAPLPLPPDYTLCVAAQQAATSVHSAGQTATFKASCASNYQTLLTEVLNYLITTYWLQGEAYDRHVHVTAAEVTKAFNQERKGANPPLATAAQLRSFLAASGQTLKDLTWRTMVQLETNKIQLQVQKHAREGHQGPDRRLLQQEQVAVRDARDPRPAPRDRLHRGDGAEGAFAARRRRQLRDDRAEVLGRSEHEVQGRRDARRVLGRAHAGR